MTEFDEIYRHYQPKMGRYLARLLGEHEAQDVLQNVMLQVSQSLPEFRGEAALSTWIYRIAESKGHPSAADGMAVPSCSAHTARFLYHRLRGENAATGLFRGQVSSSSVPCHSNSGIRARALSPSLIE